MSVVDETYSRGRQLVVEQPMAIVVGLVAVLLVVDLLNRLITGRLPPEQFMRYLWRGIVNGLVTGLAGVGLSMTYSILNFALNHRKWIRQAWTTECVLLSLTYDLPVVFTDANYQRTHTFFVSTRKRRDHVQHRR